jgi:cellulose synthase (UDP-forming)
MSAKKNLSQAIRQRISRLHLATLVVSGTIILAGAIFTAWFAGEETIGTTFYQFNQWQRNPPIWSQVPMMIGNYLLFWTVLLFVAVRVIIWLSPRPRPWSRMLVVSILGLLTFHYMLWRLFATLNLSDPLNGLFSLGLFSLELLLLSGSVIQLILLLKTTDRRSEADYLSAAVASGIFTPAVDILIPTYNEPLPILRRTVIGAQALNYAAKQIYLLDDGARPEVALLAAELGCEYVARLDRTHAKAGNLNHALTCTRGDLVVVFDADFIPTRNFLTRTVGFFQDEQVALIQTPQSFYNPDPITRNLGLENVLTSEEEVFYRQIQPIRDAAGGAICAGTSFVVRRSALEKTGCFFTESLSEDFFTGIRLSAGGYRLIYLNEKLSAGLAAESIADRALQQIRWAQGTLQAFFVSANPLTIPGLKLLQRMVYLEGIMHWFTSISRVGFLLIPLSYAFLGVTPIRATTAELLYFFLPYYLVNFSAFAWFNYYSRSALLADIYSIVLCFPLSLTAITTMFHPFGSGFKVTPKGTARDRYTFNWKLALPLIITLIATAFSLWISLETALIPELRHPGMPLTSITEQRKGFNLGIIWNIYNLIMIWISLLILLDVPRYSIYEWYDLRRTVCLRIGDRTFWGMTQAISEQGAQLVLTQSGFAPNMAETPVELKILEADLKVSGMATIVERIDDYPLATIRFDPLSLSQERQLIEMLYCRPGQWKSLKAPGELKSLWLLLVILLKPRVIFDHRASAKAMEIRKG